MTTELQRAQDLLNAITAQRDQAMNAMVHAQAEIAGMRRQLAGLESAIKEAHQERDKALSDLKDAHDNLAGSASIAEIDAATI